MVMLDAINSYFAGCIIPWPINTESQLFAYNNYINPGIYLFSGKLLSNYRILNVYFLSLVFVVLFICAATIHER